jgi:drug/metabolite transporter (DMT)-like permease
VLSAIWFGFALKKPTAAAVHTVAEVRAFNRTGLIWGLVSGVFSYGGFQLYAAVLQSGPANIVSPIFSTNGLVVVIGSILFYQEKLTKLQIIALLMLFAGLLFVKL